MAAPAAPLSRGLALGVMVFAYPDKFETKSINQHIISRAKTHTTAMLCQRTHTAKRYAACENTTTMIKSVLISFLLLFTITLKSQVDQSKEHPIDVRLKECLQFDSIQSINNIFGCYNMATEEWYKEMDKYYKLLINILSEEEKNQLEESQKNWIIIYDTSIKVLNELEPKLSSITTVISFKKETIEMIKKRAFELIKYYENKTSKNGF